MEETLNPTNRKIEKASNAIIDLAEFFNISDLDLVDVLENGLELNPGFGPDLSHWEEVKSDFY